MGESHANARLEAFCDGVFAIALTLLVIDIRLPSSSSIASTVELWRALRDLAPSAFAFVLSFIVIFITWVNHHGVLRLAHASSPSFIYANGFLLLTIVFIPFPTALLGAFLWTDHAAPAVVLYDAVLAVQAIGWIFLGGSALSDRLVAGGRATVTIQSNKRNAYFALVIYSLLALSAQWFPVAAASVTAATWLFWLTLSFRMKPS